MEYTTNSTYISLAGLLITILSHYGIVLNTTDAIQIIGVIVSLVGVIKQHFDKKRLAVSAKNAGYAVSGLSD